MSQTFSKNFDSYRKLGCFLLALFAAVATLAAVTFVRSSWITGQTMTVEQPVPFSHRHHAGEIGIDCRYCHTSVETSAEAGLPPTETCMTCHSQLYTQEKVTQPIRESWINNRPIRWKRVIELPDFVYFAHNVHVNNGVACVECHGRVDRMPLMSQEHHYTMGWCIDCHRDPSRRLRPEKQVFDPAADRPSPQERDELARFLMSQYKIDTQRLTECASCHR